MQVLDTTWITVEAAAHELKLNASTIREWCRVGAVESFRDGPQQRFVRLEDVREHIYTVRGRPRTSLATLIASSGSARRSVDSSINELQVVIRDRTDSRTPSTNGRRMRHPG